MAPPWSGTDGWSASVIVLRRTLSPWPSFRRLEATGHCRHAAFSQKPSPIWRVTIFCTLLGPAAETQGEQRRGVLFYCVKRRLSFIFRRVAGVGITEGP